MAAVARDRGVVTAIGLQGRHDPTLTYIKELYDQGWLGELLTVNLMTQTGGAYSGENDHLFRAMPIT